MATVLVRTTLANGATAQAATDGLTNFVINVPVGKIACEAIIDSAQADGYRFNVEQGSVVVAAAYRVDFTGVGKDGGQVEVYAA